MIYNLLIKLCLKIWDFLFLEGEIILFKSCLAIIKGLSKKMQDITNFGIINNIFNF